MREGEIWRIPGEKNSYIHILYLSEEYDVCERPIGEPTLWMAHGARGVARWWANKGETCVCVCSCIRFVLRCVWTNYIPLPNRIRTPLTCLSIYMHTHTQTHAHTCKLTMRSHSLANTCTRTSRVYIRVLWNVTGETVARDRWWRWE